MHDPEHLRRRQYAAPGNLEARSRLHRRFDAGGTPWFPWLFERLPREGAFRISKVVGALVARA